MGDKRSTLDIAREVFDIEIEGVVTLRDKLGADFEKLADRCASAIDAGGKIVLTGVGKSGYLNSHRQPLMEASWLPVSGLPPALLWGCTPRAQLGPHCSP